MSEEIATENTLLSLISAIQALTTEVHAIHAILKDVWDDEKHYLLVHQTTVIVS